MKHTIRERNAGRESSADALLNKSSVCFVSHAHPSPGGQYEQILQHFWVNHTDHEFSRNDQFLVRADSDETEDSTAGTMFID